MTEHGGGLCTGKLTDTEERGQRQESPSIIVLTPKTPSPRNMIFNKPLSI